jgi:hypothetical protein
MDDHADLLDPRETLSGLHPMFLLARAAATAAPT